jgi:hypothetical protein
VAVRDNVNVCRDFLKERQHHGNRFVSLSEGAEGVHFEITAEYATLRASSFKLNNAS